MKKITALLLVSIMLVAAACKKGSNSPATFYTMTASIDTVTFTADGPSQAYISGTSSGSMENTDLYGKSADGKVIQITLISAPGTPIPRGASIPFNTGQAMARYYPSGFTGNYVYGITGSIVVNAFTPNYEGSFSFTCADSTHITNGKFKIKAP